MYGIVFIVIIASAGALAFITLNNPFNNDEKESKIGVLNIVCLNGTEISLDLSDIQNLTYSEGLVEYQNKFGNWRDYGLYRGVSLSSLIELAGGIVEGDTVLIEAEDGFYSRFSYYNIYPNTTWKTIQGDMILAYSYNDTEIPNWKDGYRIAFLPDDGNYSNDDFNATTTAESRQHGFSAGSRWVKTVSSIQLERNWTVNILSSRNEILNLCQLMQFPKITGNGSMKTKVDVKGSYSFTGVSLEDLVSHYIIDGQNYSVKVIANDSWFATLTKEQVEGNMTLYDIGGNPTGFGTALPVLAYNDNGTQLDYVRLVFLGNDNPITSSGYWVNWVVKLEIVLT